VTNVGDRCDDEGSAIALDADGSAYITGQIGAICFPYPDLRHGAFVAKLDSTGAVRYLFAFGVVQPNPSDDRLCFFTLCTDAFVTKFDPSGSALVCSTYLGGNVFDGGSAIALDRAGNAYVTGYTDSHNFPTSGAFQPNGGGGQDGFVAKLDSTGSTLIYSSPSDRPGGRLHVAPRSARSILRSAYGAYGAPSAVDDGIWIVPLLTKT
jgi:hypothetical protein